VTAVLVVIGVLFLCCTVACIARRRPRCSTTWSRDRVEAVTPTRISLHPYCSQCLDEMVESMKEMRRRG
jgi:hypothetical protein